jgi:hypothetical protein
VKSIAIDTNLLLLLVVGTADRSLISKHKRTQKFTPEDFETLLALLKDYPRILVTPNVVTETSNLLRQTHEVTAKRLLQRLREILAVIDERYVRSSDATTVPGYSFLGIADAASLHEPPPGSVLLTDDLPLYLQAMKLGRSAINFTHLQFPGAVGP